MNSFWVKVCVILPYKRVHFIFLHKFRKETCCLLEKSTQLEKKLRNRCSIKTRKWWHVGKILSMEDVQMFKSSILNKLLIFIFRQMMKKSAKFFFAGSQVSLLMLILRTVLKTVQWRFKSLVRYQIVWFIKLIFFSD